MRILETHALPHVERSGLDGDLNTEERAIVDSVHRFARDALRPLDTELDQMSADQVIAPSSPFWRAHQADAELAMDPRMIDQMAPDAAARPESLIAEELGWRDVGLGLQRHRRAGGRAVLSGRLWQRHHRRGR